MSLLRRELPQVEIACTLTGPEAAARSKEFAAIGAAALISRTKTDDGIALVFEAREGVREKVEELAAAEAVCCSFLEFDLETRADSVSITITGPPEAGPVLDSLFEAVGA